MTGYPVGIQNAVVTVGDSKNSFGVTNVRAKTELGELYPRFEEAFASASAILESSGDVQGGRIQFGKGVWFSKQPADISISRLILEGSGATTILASDQTTSNKATYSNAQQWLIARFNQVQDITIRDFKFTYTSIVTNGAPGYSAGTAPESSLLLFSDSSRVKVKDCFFDFTNFSSNTTIGFTLYQNGFHNGLNCIKTETKVASYSTDNITQNIDISDNFFYGEYQIFDNPQVTCLSCENSYSVSFHDNQLGTFIAPKGATGSPIGFNGSLSNPRFDYAFGTKFVDCTYKLVHDNIIGVSSFATALFYDESTSALYDFTTKQWSECGHFIIDGNLGHTIFCGTALFYTRSGGFFNVGKSNSFGQVEITDSLGAVILISIGTHPTEPYVIATASISGEYHLCVDASGQNPAKIVRANGVIQSININGLDIGNIVSETATATVSLLDLQTVLFATVRNVNASIYCKAKYSPPGILMHDDFQIPNVYLVKATQLTGSPLSGITTIHITGCFCSAFKGIMDPTTNVVNQYGDSNLWLDTGGAPHTTLN